MRHRIVWACLAAMSLALGAPAQAAPAAPAVIKIGELYASTGSLASLSMETYDAFKLWVSQQNAAGGVYVGAFHKRIPIKLISYDDQSNPAMAATFYNQLITVDKVNLLISDVSSVLTAPAVAIAKEHKQLLFDVGAMSALFFTKDNPYITLIGQPETTVALKYLADFLDKEGPEHGIKRVAILYSTNDFTGALASALSDLIKAGGKLKIVHDQGVPTSTSNYTVLLNNLAAVHPDAVIELGYIDNDMAFLRNLQDLGLKYPFVFTFQSGVQALDLEQAVGAPAMTDLFSIVGGANYDYKPTLGPTIEALHAMWDKAHPPGSGIDWSSSVVQGYLTGVVVQRTLAVTNSLKQLDLRKAVFDISGKVTTLDGPFALNAEGAQVGEIPLLGQFQAKGKAGIDLVAVYPPRFAKATAVIPAK